MTNWPETILTIVAVLTMVGSGAAYVMRSLGNRFDEVEDKLGRVDQAVSDVRERVARIEGRLLGRR